MVLETNIKNNKKSIEIIVDNKYNDVKYMYLDTYDNRNNYLSLETKDHSFRFESSDILSDVSSTISTYIINSNDLGTDRITGLYILTVYYMDNKIETKIILDLNELYCVRMRFLSKMCNTCSDNASSRMLIVLMFREMLLRNAISFNLTDDAIKYYTDIFRPFCNSNINSCTSGLCNLN